MGAVTHPPTSSELLDHALAHQAPHLLKVLEQALRRVDELGELGVELSPDGVAGGMKADDVLAQLAAAIDRRVYIATKHHDEHIADVLDDATSRIRARYTAERETLERLDEASAGDDPTPQRDHSIAEVAAAAVDSELTASMGKRCAGCSAPLLASDPDLCELCDTHQPAATSHG